MKLIKALTFIFQFGLIGLALAVIYLVSISERSREEILSFLAGQPPAQTQSRPLQHAAPVSSYADAVSQSSASVVTIYTSKTVRQKPHPLLKDPIFSQFFGEQLMHELLCWY